MPPLNTLHPVVTLSILTLCTFFRFLLGLGFLGNLLVNGAYTLNVLFLSTPLTILLYLLLSLQQLMLYALMPCPLSLLRKLRVLVATHSVSSRLTSLLPLLPRVSPPVPQSNESSAPIHFESLASSSSSFSLAPHFSVLVCLVLLVVCLPGLTTACMTGRACTGVIPGPPTMLAPVYGVVSDRREGCSLGPTGPSGGVVLDRREGVHPFWHGDWSPGHMVGSEYSIPSYWSYLFFMGSFLFDTFRVKLPVLLYSVLSDPFLVVVICSLLWLCYGWHRVLRHWVSLSWGTFRRNLLSCALWQCFARLCPWMALIVQLSLFVLWKVVRRWYLFTGFVFDLHCHNPLSAHPFLCAGLGSSHRCPDPRYPRIVDPNRSLPRIQLLENYLVCATMVNVVALASDIDTDQLACSASIKLSTPSYARLWC